MKNVIVIARSRDTKKNAMNGKVQNLRKSRREPAPVAVVPWKNAENTVKLIRKNAISLFLKKFRRKVNVRKDLKLLRIAGA